MGVLPRQWIRRTLAVALIVSALLLGAGCERARYARRIGDTHPPRHRVGRGDAFNLCHPATCHPTCGDGVYRMPWVAGESRHGTTYYTAAGTGQFASHGSPNANLMGFGIESLAMDSGGSR